MPPVKTREVAKAARAVRRFTRGGLAALEAQDLALAAEYFERAQHAAFDAKDLVLNGGKYEPEERC